MNDGDTLRESAYEGQAMHRVRGLVGIGFTAAVAVGLSACGGADIASVSSVPSVASAPGPREARLLVPGEDRFSPFITEMAPSGALQIANQDTDAHTVTSLPGDKSQFDVTVKGGETGALTLTQPGVYRFYCKLHAKYLPDKDSVAALPSAGLPNQPMEGVIVVR